MRRAICLIVVLSALGIGFGLWADIAQRDKAREYLEGMEVIRAALMQGDMRTAASEQRYWQAMWQHDEGWMNFILSHETTRAASGALMRLGTTIELDMRNEALLALDEAADAFTRVERGDFLTTENVL